MITKKKASKLLKKLGFEPTGKGKELGFKYIHKGRMVLFASVPKGSGELRITDRFRKQLKLNHDQFAAGLACPFKGTDYQAHLVRIGHIDG